MQDMGALVIVLFLMGLVFRLSSAGDGAKQRGPGAPARFLYFTGRRLAITKQIPAHSADE